MAFAPLGVYEGSQQDGRPGQVRRRKRFAPLFHWACTALALALPFGSTALAASAATDTSSSEAKDDDAAPLPDASPGAATPFAAAFADLDAPLTVTGPAPGAVDVTLIEPPRGPQILRSLGTRTASYYGKRFHGRRTANGERFDMNAMTAAHKTLPFGTHVLVTNPANGRSVTVRINDRGPFIRGRSIDLSRGAAEELGIIRRGHARVQLDIVAP
ncbi:MAG: septal ring lytic transglycosylase RlpA family protein [Pseudomonadota bacterium]